ncbi:hypothetical protein WICPIJ_008200 [Wickerhamomyces pijperi]|uniref:Uncharacterized protein n=1 Tax=Wickerhamomyces pijperi TaxID=599730 RepID=A0A9P8TJ20_WICPI|nr:hypothetical protein WICPIJ_008200 [Wickerhamomyces pijperi]
MQHGRSTFHDNQDNDSQDEPHTKEEDGADDTNDTGGTEGTLDGHIHWLDQQQAWDTDQSNGQEEHLDLGLVRVQRISNVLLNGEDGLTNFMFRPFPSGFEDSHGLGEQIIVHEPSNHGENTHQQQDVTTRESHVEDLVSFDSGNGLFEINQTGSSTGQDKTMTQVTKHNGEHEWEGDNGRQPGIDLLVLGNTVGVTKVLEGIGELVGLVVCWWSSGGFQDVQNRLQALRVVQQDVLDTFDFSRWDPTFTDQSLYGGVQDCVQIGQVSVGFGQDGVSAIVVGVDIVQFSIKRLGDLLDSFDDLITVREHDEVVLGDGLLGLGVVDRLLDFSSFEEQVPSQDSPQDLLQDDGLGSWDDTGDEALVQ